MPLHGIPKFFGNSCQQVFKLVGLKLNTRSTVSAEQMMMVARCANLVDAFTIRSTQKIYFLRICQFLQRAIHS